jgi:UDP-N-acetylmuramate--alanine ligase
MEGGIQTLTDRLDRIVRDPSSLVHFVGIAGTGMSALAQYRALQGGRVSGSDRSFDRAMDAGDRAWADRLAIRIGPQDGSRVAGSDLVVTSTAVEDTIPDVRRARELGIPIAHRAEVLAAFVRARPTIAVTGSSGKSTVVAMIFEALRGAGLDPGVLTGGELLCLKAGDLRGNAWLGRDWLVIEADESDKSLVHYAPEIGVILNVHRDHYEAAEVLRVFGEFRRRVRRTAVIGACDELSTLRGPGAVTFGLEAGADVPVTGVTATKTGSTFHLAGVPVTLGTPGLHNVLNAAAALAACRATGADVARAAGALAGYRGVSRRFEIVGRAGGVEVVDDFAHNPAKVTAALATARARSRRVLAFFQPHGFAPMRFMRHDLVRAFAEGQRPQDRLFLPEILYVGGTAARDLSARDLCADVGALGGHAQFLEDRAALPGILGELARPGDCVLIMGARDPSLGAFARAVAAGLPPGLDEREAARPDGLDVGV